MEIKFSIEEAVQKRYSVRNYIKKEVALETRKQIDTFINSLDNPFQKKIKFHYKGIDWKPITELE